VILVELEHVTDEPLQKVDCDHCNSNSETTRPVYELSNTKRELIDSLVVHNRVGDDTKGLQPFAWISSPTRTKFARAGLGSPARHTNPSDSSGVSVSGISFTPDT
jgi:hypothetical protein